MEPSVIHHVLSMGALRHHTVALSSTDITAIAVMT